MRLRRLELKNFRQHQNSKIEFGSGMTAIVGPNGSGKSTILEAITFALYGEYRANRESLKFLWAEGTDRKMSVLLEFDLGSRRLQVERRDDTAFLKEVVEDEIRTLANQIRPVTAEVTRLLGLSYEQFVNSFCAEQKSLAFLAGKASDTHREIARMLGFDRLKVAEDQAKNEARTLKRSSQIYEEAVASKPAKEAVLVEARSALKAKETEIEAADAALREIVAREAEATAGRERATQWSALRDRAITLREQGTAAERAMKQAEEAVGEASKLIAEREQLAPKAREYDEAIEAHRAWEEKRKEDAERAEKQARADAQRQSLDQRQPPVPVDLESLERAVREAMDAANAAKKAFADADAEYLKAQREAERELTESTAALKHARERFERARKLVDEGKCPECEQPIGEDFGGRIESLAQDVTAKEADQVRCRTRVEALVRRPEPLMALERRRDEAEKAYGLAQSAHERAKATAEEQARQAASDAAMRGGLAELERWLEGHPPLYDAAAHEAVQAKLKALDTDYRRYLALGDVPRRLADAEAKLTQARAEFESLKQENASVKEEMARLGIADDEAAEKLASAYSVWATERDAKTSLVATLRADLDVRRSTVEVLERDLAEIVVAEQKLIEARRDQVHHDATAVQMGRLREALNARLKPDLEARASSHLAALTENRYPILNLDDAFQPQILDGNAVKAVLSGGEEDIVALAMRMALSELIQERHGDPLTLLILDEAFGSLDADRRSSLLDRLSAMRGKFEQVLIISHIEEINQIADQCLYVTRDPRTRSSVVSDVPPEGLMVAALVQGL